MKREKEALLAPIADEIEQNLKAYAFTDDKPDLNLINSKSATLEILRGAPEWPYNTSVMSRFLGAWASFLFALLLAISTELVTKPLP